MFTLFSTFTKATKPHYVGYYGRLYRHYCFQGLHAVIRVATWLLILHKIAASRLSITPTQLMGLGVIQYTSYSALLNHTMPCHVGLYCSGWVKTGPVGVILTTMDNAFETAELIVEDFNQGSQPHEYYIAYLNMILNMSVQVQREKVQCFSYFSCMTVCS